MARGDNKCAGCGEWSGRGHKCPANKRPVNNPKLHPITGLADDDPRPNVQDRVTRGQEHLAQNATTPSDSEVTYSSFSFQRGMNGEWNVFVSTDKSGFKILGTANSEDDAEALLPAREREAIAAAARAYPNESRFEQWRIAQTVHGINRTHRVGDAYVWSSNDEPPPRDVLEVWERTGLITPAERAATNALRGERDAQFLAAYREQAKGRRPSAEELNEMRSEFGANATVVDALTGQRINLGDPDPRFH